MRLLLCSDTLLCAFELEEKTSIYWPQKQLRLRVTIRTQNAFLEILSDACFHNGLKQCELSCSQAAAIHAGDEKVICIFQKQQRAFQRYQLKPSEIWLGRDEHCDLVYKDLTVSKRHCRLYFDEQWHIEDAGSANGVYLNENRVQKSVLNVGDCLFLGGIEIWFGHCFLLAMVPDCSYLPVFCFQPTSPPVLPAAKKPEWLPSCPQAPQMPSVSSTRIPFSFSRDVLTVLVFSLLLFWQTSESAGFYRWTAVMLAVIRLIDMFWHIGREKYQQRKACREYEKARHNYRTALQIYYPNCLDLEKQFLVMGGLMLRKKAVVRLGINEQQEVILHDFEQFPHFVIKGEKEKADAYVRQILYQLLVYDANLHIQFEKRQLEECFCQSFYQNTEKTLWVGSSPAKTDKTHFWIEKVTGFSQARHGFDALLDLDDCQYTTTKTNSLHPDDAFDSTLFSHYYGFFHVRPPSAFHYWQLLQLDSFSVTQLRAQRLIEQQLGGCIGHTKQQPLYLDLHEKRDGPHLLVAGMTGSGKSEWLISYLMSMAVFYDSQEVQFFFIDFKGGGLSQVFESLPHTVMILTNLEPMQITRAIAALEDELKDREMQLLKAAKISGLPNLSIHDLNRLYRQKRTDIHFAHLLIIVDEFAELKLLYPEMMQALIRIARIGRSLGIHLILSTQRPGGIVDGQILSNIKTRICLKVASRQESYDILNRNDAAYLKKAGEFYCQRADAAQLLYGQSLMVNDIPSSMVLYDLDFVEKMRIPLERNLEQPLDRLMSHLKDISSLTMPLYYKDFCPLQPEQQRGKIAVYDDYVHRKMPVLYHDFKTDGPILIVGASAQILASFQSHWPAIKEVSALETLDKETVYLFRQFSSQSVALPKLSDFISSHACIFVEKDASGLKPWLTRQCAVQFIFDKQAAENLLYTKLPFTCDLSRQIGILYLKGTCYRCQIQPFAC